MVSTCFLLLDYLEKIQFFKKTYLLVQISMEVILAIFFFTLNNVNIEIIKLKKHI